MSCRPQGFGLRVPTLWVCGSSSAEGAAFGIGEEMTPAVTAGLDELVASVLRELEEVPCTSGR